MTQLAFEQLRQRADYTHKYNLKNGRHGWLRLTPAYSVRVVEELLATASPKQRVLDPFCGTATTALSAIYHGHEAVTTDINPFLIWLGQAKIARYSAAVIANASRAGNEAVRLTNVPGLTGVAPPPIHNITRWWEPVALDFLCRLQATLAQVVAPNSPEGTLLRVAFCRTLIACSNAAFNHQSMSFKKASAAVFAMDYGAMFTRDVSFVLQGANENPIGSADVLLQDARQLASLAVEPIDLVITSPPYANRMSYIRELRPYMYWLRMLVESREAGELDWLAIGGTWGIATSRLNEWQPAAESYSSVELTAILEAVAHADNANGALLAAYINKYCVDMANHFAGLRSLLAPGARLHYIVGNSTFYGIMVPAEKLYAHMLHNFGYTDIHIRPIRKRNSKKELVEFDVSARWPS